MRRQWLVLGCYSGTQDPCGPYNEAFGASYICCTYGDTTREAVGYCVAEKECVAPPNTGSGPIDQQQRLGAGSAVALRPPFSLTEP
ncbi:MAG: hypothetical protein R2848_06225 [Thermomicrobiales bacterium]